MPSPTGGAGLELCPLLWSSVCPSEVPALKPPAHCDSVRGGAAFGGGPGHEGGALTSGVGAPLGEPRELSALPPREDAVGRHGTRGRPSPDPESAGRTIPDTRPPARWEVNACCSQAPSPGCPATDNGVGVTRGKRGAEGEEGKGATSTLTGVRLW